MQKKSSRVNSLTQFARNLDAKLIKKFLVLFSKRTLFLLKLTFKHPDKSKFEILTEICTTLSGGVLFMRAELLSDVR